MARDFNALTMTHRLWREKIQPGALCIDATAGKGRDTAVLCGLVGETGRVLAFDIQQDAVDATRRLVEELGYGSVAQVHLDSHSNMARYAAPQSVDCIAFNFGWLPGGDHHVFTRPESSIAAINAGLELLKPGGIMTLCIYYGKETGFAERDALLEFLPSVDSTRFTVLLQQFYNRPNNPPIPVFIFREH